eukprot:gnl/Dysnectes_brevis/327_a361_2704.p1 GENE.gnl/Dysnectes_brevis/327_a361_2704~~gnl/Dysnectes_brevis/327_a361_2704.p1  ORF type:complete len:433 (+),score=98.22 gnl/Dysnectes_brevis/327_a361_2704:2035-3333(+)
MSRALDGYEMIVATSWLDLFFDCESVELFSQEQWSSAFKVLVHSYQAFQFCINASTAGLVFDAPSEGHVSFHWQVESDSEQQKHIMQTKDQLTISESKYSFGDAMCQLSIIHCPGDVHRYQVTLSINHAVSDGRLLFTAAHQLMSILTNAPDVSQLLPSGVSPMIEARAPLFTRPLSDLSTSIPFHWEYPTMPAQPIPMPTSDTAGGFTIRWGSVPARELVHRVKAQATSIQGILLTAQTAAAFPPSPEPVRLRAMVPMDLRAHPLASDSFTSHVLTPGAGALFPALSEAPTPSWPLARAWTRGVNQLRGDAGPVLHVLALSDYIPRMQGASPPLSEQETRVLGHMPKHNIGASNLGRCGLKEEYSGLRLVGGARMFPFSPRPAGPSGLMVHGYTVGDRFLWGWVCPDYLPEEEQRAMWGRFCSVMRGDVMQ